MFPAEMLEQLRDTGGGQQMQFMMPGQVDRTFMENLAALGPGSPLMMKVVMPDSLRATVLAEGHDRLHVEGRVQKRARRSRRGGRFVTFWTTTLRTVEAAGQS
jgi:hypothetical protein